MLARAFAGELQVRFHPTQNPEGHFRLQGFCFLGHSWVCSILAPHWQGGDIRMNKGIWYGIGAYVTWGLFPIYWKWLHHVPAVQLISHRVLWSFLLLAVFIVASRQWNVFRAAALKPRVLRIYLVAAVLIGINWLVYIWAVNAGFIVEASLGYYINPLLNVLMGVLFLRERLRSLQWVPLGLAAVGVLYLTFAYGSLPWIALALAFSFGVYGLVKKTAPLGSLYGLALETGLLFLPALFYLLYSETISVNLRPR
jgi:chloramphenicol-sensitive protein RarD